MRNRLFLIAGATAVLCLAAAGFLYHASRGEAPMPAAKPLPQIDVSALTPKAEQGDPEAQVLLGKAFAEGNGARLDFKQAARWYGMAASNGNVEAEAMLGELYQAGQGLPHDLTNAVRWFTKAALQGSTAAQYDLAFMYERGQGVPHDDKQAAHWYQLGAEGGDALSQFDYGQRCVLGVGVAKDPVQGLKWLLIAAKQGQEDARTRANLVSKGLTSEQVAEAKSRAATFAPRVPPR